VLLSSVLVAAVLVGSAAIPTQPQMALLERLHVCLRNVALQSPSAPSPCSGTDASSLVGLSRDKILEALGTPSFCHKSSLQDFLPWAFAECRSPGVGFGYSFYRLPLHVVGGGSELVFIVDATGRVISAGWVTTQ
jgi:hypothetical protein